MREIATVVVVVTLVVLNGELFVSPPNVDGVKGVVVVLVIPKPTLVLVAPNGVLFGVALVPNVSLTVPVFPNVSFGNEVVLVVSNCEVAVEKGPPVVEGVVPNGAGLEVDIAGVVFCAFPNMFTEGVEVVTPKAFVGCVELKLDVVVLDPLKMLAELANVGFSPNIELVALPKAVVPPKTGPAPNAGVASAWENIPELKVPADGVDPNIELVVCKFEEPLNGLAVVVLAPPNIDVLD